MTIKVWLKASFNLLGSSVIITISAASIVASLSIHPMATAIWVFACATIWEAIFADVGVALLAVLNSMRISKMKG